MFELIEREIESAIAVHLSWKNKIDATIISACPSVSAEQVRDDHLCAFGKWIYSRDLPVKIGRSIEKFNIERLHSEFHDCAANLIQFVADAKSLENTEYALMLSAYERSSATLVRALSEWRDVEIRALLTRQSSED